MTPNANIGNSVRNITIMALCTAVLLVSQLSLSGIPNIELVSLLLIVYTLVFKRRVLFIIYAFVLLEGLIFGFHLWWISYLYVWMILACLAWAFRAARSSIIWAIVSGAFGLFFGALCAIPYFFIGGASMALANWVSGIPFDIVHCVSNFVLCLILWKPLYALLAKIVR